MFVRIAEDGDGIDLAIDEWGGPRCLRWGALTPDPVAELDTLLARPWEHQYPGLARHRDGRLAAPNKGGAGLPLVPGLATFWPFSGGLVGHRANQDWTPRFRFVGLEVDGVEIDMGTQDKPGRQITGGQCTIGLHSEESDLDLAIIVRARHGVVGVRAQIINGGQDDYTLDSLTVTLPVPEWMEELLDFAGRWSHERVPQRHPFAVGQWRRESRWGRPGHENVWLLAAGEPGFDFAAGHVRACHVAWSGNSQTFAETTVDGARLIGGGELLLPGEVVLAPGQEYQGAEVVFVHGDGLDDLSARLHDLVRGTQRRGDRPRAVNYNCWEAVELHQDTATLMDLATRAARAGAERFVLDDGWFLGRYDWGHGLGDWSVDESVHAGGLGQLVDHVRGLGLQFGLWFEPEMMSSTSQVAKDHPEWLMTAHGAAPASHPADQVMNLDAAGAADHVHAQIAALVRRYGIDYLKWDHNRPLSDPGDFASGRPVARANVLRLYEIIDRLREEFPSLEIETCAGGGGRIDLGMLSRTDRVWVSDSMDAVDRIAMQTWTSLVVPPEMMGSHIGSQEASISRRLAHLDFRSALCVFGHFGIEWDLTTATAAELHQVRGWSDFYRRFRQLVATGRMVRRLGPDATFVWGSVAAGASEALYLVGTTGSTLAASAAPARLPGLDAAAKYRVEALLPDPLPARQVAPSWFGHPDADASALVASGALLMEHGLPRPIARPQQAFFVHVEKV